jgi:hypothetical protein
MQPQSADCTFGSNYSLIGAMMKKVFLHIGTPMTGTSDIQDFLLLNRSILKEKGFDYPSHYIDDTGMLSMGNECGLMQMYTEKGKTEAERAVRELLHSSDADSLLLSSDNFFRFPEETYQLFPEATIIIVLGPQFERLLLTYIQKVRYSGHKETFSAELDHFYKNRNMHFYLYRLLEKWFSLYSGERMILLPVWQDLFLEKKVYPEFLSRIGIADTSGFMMPETFSYIPYCRDAVEYKLLLNQLFGSSMEASANLAIDHGLIRYSKEYYAEIGSFDPFASEAEVKKVNALYAEKNNIFAREILHHPNGFMFPPVLTSRQKTVYEPLTPERILKLTEYILRNSPEKGLESVYIEKLGEAKKSSDPVVKQALQAFNVLFLVIEQRLGGDTSETIDEVDDETAEMIEKVTALYLDGQYQQCIDLVEKNLDTYGSNFVIRHYYLQSLFATVAEGEELALLREIEKKSRRLGNIQRFFIYAELLENIPLFKRTIDALVARMETSSFLDLERLMVYTSWIDYDRKNIEKEMHSKYVQLKESDPEKVKSIDAAGVYFLGEKKKIQQKTLIVSGNPRSGTTALGDLLNLSDDIGLFLERYNYALGYHPNMFREEYLFSPIFTDTELSKQNEALKKKIGHSKYIGDKRPRFFVSWPITVQNYEPDDIRIVHISRNIYDVAYSYEQRAKWARDGLDKGWFGNRGTLAACQEANVANLRTVEALKDPEFKDSIYVVEYEKVYRSIDNFKKLFSYLEVEWTDGVQEKVEAFLEKSKGLEKKQRILSDENRKIIEAHYDFDLHNQIVKRSRTV